MKNLIFFLLLFLFLATFSLNAQILGDVNNDNKVDIIDALFVARYYVRQQPYIFIESAADVDRNTKINIVDALFIAQYYVGLITEFPTNGPTPTPEIKDTYTLTIETATTSGVGYTRGIMITPPGESSRGGTYSYETGTVVHLSAPEMYINWLSSPHAVIEFEYWEGDYAPGYKDQTNLEIIMDRDKVITAYFKFWTFYDVPQK